MRKVDYPFLGYKDQFLVLREIKTQLQSICDDLNVTPLYYQAPNGDIELGIHDCPTTITIPFATFVEHLENAEATRSICKKVILGLLKQHSKKVEG